MLKHDGNHDLLKSSRSINLVPTIQVLFNLTDQSLKPHLHNQTSALTFELT